MKDLQKVNKNYLIWNPKSFKRNPEDLIYSSGAENRIKTKAWFSYLLKSKGLSNANQLFELFKDNKNTWASRRNLYDYSNGKIKPSTTKLKLAEQNFPGSKDIFDHGFDVYPLWELMFEPAWSVDLPVWFEIIVPKGEQRDIYAFDCYQNADYVEVIQNLNDLPSSMGEINQRPKAEIFHNGNLISKVSVMGVWVWLIRHLIDRSRFINSAELLFEAFYGLGDIFRDEELILTLSKFGIMSEMTGLYSDKNLELVTSMLTGKLSNQI